MSSAATQWATDELALLAEQGLMRKLETIESPQGAHVTIAGQVLINFSSNDYLGLANDQRLVVAAIERMRTHGLGSGASRLIAGDTTMHRALEARIASFERSEAACLFGSGYAANVGIISTFCKEGDVIFSDALNHASLVDGCRLSKAKIVVYPHADSSALSDLLREHRGRRRLVCTDSVFSMDGDHAPLHSLAVLCREHDAALLVDEAHATGVFGSRGAGLVEALGLEDSVDVRMGTLGKALGVYGAYAAASGRVVDLLINRARSLVFSTSLPGGICAAALAAIELVENEPELRARLWRNIERFASGLGVEPRSAVFPIVLGDPERALAAAARLRKRGVWVKPIRPPTVPAGTSRLRFAISAAHSLDDIDHALLALEEEKVVRERA